MVTSTRLDVFERAVQKAERWLDPLTSELHWESRHQAYEALGIVLHVLRDRLPLKQAVALGGHLPILLRGLYYQDWDVNINPEKYRHAEDFLRHVRAGLVEHRLEFVSEELLVEVVALTLTQRLREGELDGVRRALPPRIRVFFEPAPVQNEEKTWIGETRAWDKHSV